MLDQCLCAIEVILYLSTKQPNMATGHYCFGGCDRFVLSVISGALRYPHLHLLLYAQWNTERYTDLAGTERARRRFISRLQIWYPLSVQPCVLSNSTPSQL